MTVLARVVRFFLRRASREAPLFRGNKDLVDTYWDDWDIVMERLQPKLVLLHGIVPDKLKGKVEPMKDAYTPFSAKMERIKQEEKESKTK